MSDCTGGQCLIEYFHNNFAGGMPMCVASGCFWGDLSSLSPNFAAAPDKNQSFHVCDTDSCNMPADAESNPEICMNFPAPQAFTRSGTDEAPSYKGPFEDYVPMGITSGQHTNLYYRSSDEKITFSLVFPDSTKWAGFHFFVPEGGQPIQSLADNGSPTSGYECLVEAGEPAPSRVSCRGRRLRHVMPSASLYKEVPRLQAWECSPQTGNMSWPPGSNSSLCRYTAQQKFRSLGVGAGPIVFITDILEVEELLPDFVVNHDGGFYNATWSRPRVYPFDNISPRMTMRWAVAPRCYNWTVADLCYHGSSSEGNRVVGNDFMHNDPAEAPLRRECYNAEMNMNEYSLGSSMSGGVDCAPAPSTNMSSNTTERAAQTSSTRHAGASFLVLSMLAVHAVVH
eukprot:CAMPEP_0170572670 /NCGR_PEP_ID=MMETSP0224-20130122/2340_1 /TAXON_ID=285029 /ORGANISM="Togula jolla, Strain CCCM 725" /LENGTH=396 /DNA_ID=CAMNT_0010895175 /DNA_START=134 /DNA_END=1324 /DNA_ORIENTATION=-